jgi:hypothetical protein
MRGSQTEAKPPHQLLKELQVLLSLLLLLFDLRRHNIA